MSQALALVNCMLHFADGKKTYVDFNEAVTGYGWWRL